jgi:DNA-binding transcriptional MerR regulator
LQPKKNKKGNRLFTVEDVENLRVIFHLVKERGYTLQGARTKLRESKTVVAGNAGLYESLMKIRGFLVELKEQL